MSSAQFRLLVDQVAALRAEVHALREANVVLLKILVAFPAGQTPERWMAAALEKARREITAELDRVLPPPGADGSVSPFASPRVMDHPNLSSPH